MAEASSRRDRCHLDHLERVVKLASDKAKLQLDQIISVVLDRVFTVRFLPHEEFQQELPKIEQHLREIHTMVKSLQGTMKEYSERHNIEVPIWSDELVSELSLRNCDISGSSPARKPQGLISESLGENTLSVANRYHGTEENVHLGNVVNPAVNMNCFNKVTTNVQAPFRPGVPLPASNVLMQPGVPPYRPAVSQSSLVPPGTLFPMPSDISLIVPAIGMQKPMADVSIKGLGTSYGNHSTLKNIHDNSGQMDTLEGMQRNAMGQIQNMGYLENHSREIFGDIPAVIEKSNLNSLLARYQTDVKSLTSMRYPMMSLQDIGKVTADCQSRIGEKSRQASAEAEILRQFSVAAKMLRQGSLEAEISRQASLEAEMSRQASLEAEMSRQVLLKAEMSREGSLEAEMSRQASLEAEMSRQASLEAEMSRQASLEAEMLRLLAVEVEMSGQGSAGANVWHADRADINLNDSSQYVADGLPTAYLSDVNEVEGGVSQSDECRMRELQASKGITLGEPVDLYLTHVRLPNLAWIQMSDCGITDLEENLSEMFATEGVKELDAIHPGLKIAAKYESDGCYYRAVVTEYREGEALRVLFIDYGNSEFVRKKDLYSLPPDLMDIPAMAIPCVVTHIDDVAVDCKAREKNDVLQRKLQPYVINGNPLKAVFKQLPKNHKYDVTSPECPRYNICLFREKTSVKVSLCQADELCWLWKDEVREETEASRVQDISAIASKIPSDHSYPKDRCQSGKAGRGEKARCWSPSQVEEGVMDSTGSFKSSVTYSSNSYLKSPPSSDSGIITVGSSTKESTGNNDKNSFPDPNPLLVNLVKQQVLLNAEQQPVILAHVKTPNLFYLHFVNNETSNIDRFHEVLNDHYKDDKEVLNLKELPIGSYWAVCNEDGFWYRGLVTANIVPLSSKKKKSTTRVKVRFVDYGDDGIVSINDVRVLHEDFTLMPTLAVPCSLAQVVPSDRWPDLSSDASKETFVKKCGGYKAVLFARFQSCNGNGIYSVILENEDNVVINESMADSEQASPEVALQTDQESFASLTDVTNKKGIRECSRSITLPSVGTYVAAVVTVVVSPSHFYICFPHGINDLRLAHASNGGENENLIKLASAMYQHYRYSLPQSDYIMAKDELMIVCEINSFRGAQEYSRVRILDTRKEKDATAVKVFFIDHGEVSWVKEEQLRPLAPQFSNLAPQAVLCWLDGIDQPSNGWDVKQTYHLQKLTEGLTLVAHITCVDSVQERLGVILYGTDQRQDININMAFKGILQG